MKIASVPKLVFIVLANWLFLGCWHDCVRAQSEKTTGSISTHETFPDYVTAIARFRAMNRRNLELQTASNDDSLALAAAWELVRREMLNNYEGTTKNRNERPTNWFLGFVEGRIRIRPPAIWRNTLSSGTFDVRQFFPDITNYRDKSIGITWDPEEKMWITNKFKLAKLENGFQISSNSNYCFVPTRIIRSESIGGVACHFELDTGFIMFYAKDVALRTSIVCTKLNSSKPNQLIWEQKVWASGTSAATGGASAERTKTWSNYVALISKDEDIYVYGTSGGSIYLEAFRKTDGARIVSFNSSN